VENAEAMECRVAVVIVNYGTPELTMRSVAALAGERRTLPNLKAIVVDGGSLDQSAVLLGKHLEMIQYRDWVTFLPLSLNGGFGWANNQAILELARQPRAPDFIHLLNPDTQVTEGAVANLVDELRDHPECAAVGSQLLNSDGTLAASAFRFPSVAREFVGGAHSEQLGRLLGIPTAVVNSAQSTEVDWVTGASFMVRVQALQQGGLFDDGFFLYFEEVELMHRLRRRGWSIRHVPRSRVLHYEGAATGLGASIERPHPLYWYESRRRYFGLTGGRAAVLASGIAVIAGKAVGSLKRIAGRNSASRALRARDLINLGFLPIADDVRPSVPKWGEAPGKPPAWMRL
jgi:N-acetylglucosaminyl-diphospho-decaprenol L-rhamnosyltransferase